MDWGGRQDPHETSAQTENRSPGRATITDPAAGRSLSEDWIPNPENRNLRPLLWHRHRLVQMRTRVMNQLHVIALNEGLRLKKALWRPAGRAQLESLERACWSRRRRQDLLEILDQLTPKIQELTRALEVEVEKRPVARRLMTHPGVGPLTALAFELVIGTQNALAAASRSPAMWGWCRRRSPAGIGDGWATSANRATLCCVFCWWKQLR